MAEIPNRTLQRGLEMLETLRPDLAFLDIRMPGVSGIDVARAL